MLIRKEYLFKPSIPCSIDYNYQHDIMQNIYYYLSTVNKDIEKSLYNEGYRHESGHRFKLFGHTLRFKNAKFNKENIVLNEDSIVSLIITGKTDVIRNIANGLLHVKKIKINNLELKLFSANDDSKIKFKKIMLYKTLSPVVESTKNNKFYSPYESEYYINLVNNLKRKYQLMHGKEYTDEIYFDIENALDIKKKCFKMKNGYINGYNYNIWVEASPDMQKIIYYLGLGQNNSVGAGILSYITGRNAI